jgi:hypothetical protein
MDFCCVARDTELSCPRWLTTTKVKENVMKFKLAGSSALLVMLVLFAIAAVPTGLNATQNDGQTPAAAIELPKETGTSTSSSATHGAVWVKLKDLDNNKKPKAAHIEVKQKTHYSVRQYGNQVRAVKIHEITYHDENGTQHTISVSSHSSGGDVGNGDTTSQISIADIEAVAAAAGKPAVNWEKPIKIEYEQRGANGQPSGTQQAVRVNTGLLNTMFKPFVGVIIGPFAWFAAVDEFPPVLEFAEQVLGLQASEYDTPDLVLYSYAAPKVGNIVFVPMGQFRFGSTPEAVHIFDGSGTDLASIGAISFETYVSSKGELVVSVVEVDPAMIADFAMIVRGVEVVLDDNADAGSVHCYSVGGSALVHLTVNAAAIAEGTRVLDNWEGLTWTPAYSLKMTEVPVWDEVEETTTTQRVGVDRPTVVSGADNTGFLSAFVIEGADAESISAGRVVIRPTGGFQFVEDQNTKLYVVNAATGANVSSEVTAALRVNSSGFLVVDLQDFGAAAGLRLQIIVVSPKVSFDAPIAYGNGYSLNIYGTAVKSAMTENLILLEGGDPEESDSNPPLPTEPIVTVHGWTAAATMTD